MNDRGMPHPAWAGFKAACGLPAMGLFCALAGFGALTEAGGLPLWMMIASVILIWSMPALMTFNEVMVTAGGLSAMFVAVSFANVRTIPMVVTALPMVRTLPGIRWIADLSLAQLMSPTTWIHILMTGADVPADQRRTYFIVFSITVLAAALAGALVGYYGVNQLPAPIRPALLLLTPLYLTLIMLSVRKRTGYLSLALGAVFVPILMHWSVEWGLAVGGLLTGTAGFFLGGGHKTGTTS